MTDLRLVAVTPERTHLVLEDDAGNQFRVPVDERLAAALRTDRPRPGQLEITLESQLTPREIQSRIRAGASIAEVAAVAGISESRVERYAGPVLAEREHIVDTVKAGPARRRSGGGAPALEELVDRRLADRPVAPDSLRWDAWRTDEHSWTVRLSYAEASHGHAATWTYDPRGQVLVAADDEARWLVDEAEPERGPAAGPQPPVRRLASVPGAGGEAAPPVDPADQVYDREADEARAAEAASTRGVPTRQVARSGRRPVVPSWDDIMFGTRRPD